MYCMREHLATMTLISQSLFACWLGFELFAEVRRIPTYFPKVRSALLIADAELCYSQALLVPFILALRRC